MNEQRSRLESLLSDLHPQLFRHTRTRLAAQGCHGCVEDVFQDSLRSICKSFSTFRGQSRGEFCQWCHVIIRRRIAEHSRSGHRRPMSFSDLAPNGAVDVEADPEPASLEVDELLNQIRAALQELPPEQAEAFRMRHLDELDYSEIATRQGCSEETARWRVFRACRRLAALLGVDPEILGEEPDAP